MLSPLSSLVKIQKRNSGQNTLIFARDSTQKQEQGNTKSLNLSYMRDGKFNSALDHDGGEYERNDAHIVEILPK
jgi:hypothetical protein